MEIVFLGSGTSCGVPVIGCECEVCTSDNPRNNRTRSSLHVETSECNFIIDTSPEFRLQLLRENISTVDFILFTHAHADHIMGLDDIRPLNKNNSSDGSGEPLDCYAKPETAERIKQAFDYIFEDTPNESWKPQINLETITSQRE
ncbi:MAG: MBL fold metallo-hydrolase, partial [bacterium]